MDIAAKLACGASAISIGIALTLTGCSSPQFVNPPPAAYSAPAPGAVNGTWANEVDNGQRVRLSGQQDGTLKLYFSQTKPSPDHAPAEPLVAQTLHFDNSDWILLDFRRLAAWQGETYNEKSPYRLLKFVLETPNRLCGIEFDTAVFADAITSGQLEGKVFSPPPRLPQPPSVSVTSPGEVWAKWWTALPESRKQFGRKWCFVRAT